MEIFSWNVRGVGYKGFFQQVHEFINLYYPDICFLMKTKANANKAEKMIKKFSSEDPFYIEVSPIGFVDGLGCHRKNSQQF